MKKVRFISIVLSLAIALCSTPTAGAAVLQSQIELNDSNITTSIVETADYPQGLPDKFKSVDFALTISNKTVPVYKAANNAWGNPISYASFDFCGDVQIVVTVDFDFSTARILPRNAGVSCQVQGNSVVFSIDTPQNLTILFDENFQGKVLHLFAQELEDSIPDSNNENVIYFGPGYYDYSNQDPLMISSNTTLYLAKGAVIMGRILIADAENVTICGRGILLNDFLVNDGEFDEVPLVIKRSTDIEIRDITISRDQTVWAAFMANSRNVTVESVKIVNPRYSSSDGFDIANCQDVVYNNLFIRSCDDAISIKGTGIDGYNTNENPLAGARPTERILIQNCQIWSDTNNALEIGAETIAPYFRNIRFKNIDILYNYDNYDHPDMITYQSAINICVLNATDLSEIYFEDIRVEKAKTLISISCQQTYYFGGIIGNQEWNGRVHDISYRNITSYSDGSNLIRLYGFDENHIIEDVMFENITINGSQIHSFQEANVLMNAYAKDIKIVDGSAVLAIADGPIGITALSAAREYTDTQGKNGWRYLAWNTNDGIQEMTWDTEKKQWSGPKYWDLIQKESDSLLLLPNSQQLLLEWTSHYVGDIRIEGHVAKMQAGGDGVLVSIWKNDTLIWPQDGSWQPIAAGDFDGYSHDITISIDIGDTITFRVDQNRNEAYDQVIWNPQIDVRSAGGPYQYATFSASDEFGSVQNSRGWNYQILNDAAQWVDMTWNATNQQWKGIKYWDQLRKQGDGIVMLPESQRMKMVLEVEQAGIARIIGSVAKYQIDGGDGVAVSIWKNDTMIWPASEEWQQIAYNDATGYPYDFKLPVEAGDQLSFCVDRNLTVDCDQTVWKTRVFLITE